MRIGGVFIVPVMDVQEDRYCPVSYFHETVPYCIDSWSQRYAEWIRSFQRQRVARRFFSAIGRILPERAATNCVVLVT